MTIQPYRLALSRLFLVSCIVLSSNLAVAEVTIPENCSEQYDIPVCDEEDQIEVEINGPETTFRIEHLRALDTQENYEDCTSGLNSFQLFWDFGDGQYACGLDEDAEAGNLFITHEYAEDGQYSPRLIVTKRYTDNDPDLLQKVGGPIDLGTWDIQSSLGASSSVVLGADSCIKITPIHHAHVDEDIWMMVHFRTKLPYPPTIQFQYDQDLFSYESSALYVLEGNTIYPLPMVESSEGLSLNVPETLPTGLHHILIQLHTRNLDIEDAPYIFSVSTSPVKGCSVLTYSTPEKKIGPKDPNTKTVDITLTSSPVPETLTYTISFYNVGTWQTSEITIEDYISPMLDLCHFQMKKVTIDGNPRFPNTTEYNEDFFEPDINYSTRTLTWEIPHSLMGLWQEEAGYNLSSDELSAMECELNEITETTEPDEVANCDTRTRMELEFSIQTNCTFDFGDTIENEARIQFDDLEWFTTSPARTEKVCCDTTMNTTIMQGDFVHILSLYNGTITAIDTSSIIATFDSGISNYDTATGIFQYYIVLDSLDRVVFTVCDTLTGDCDTTETFLCVYKGITFTPCSNSCEDTPCPPTPPAPEPEPCTFLFWQIKKCWIVHLLTAMMVGIGLFGLLILIRKRNG